MASLTFCRLPCTSIVSLWRTWHGCHGESKGLLYIRQHALVCLFFSWVSLCLCCYIWYTPPVIPATGIIHGMFHLWLLVIQTIVEMLKLSPLAPGTVPGLPNSLLLAVWQCHSRYALLPTQLLQDFPAGHNYSRYRICSLPNSVSLSSCNFTQLFLVYLFW